MEIKVYDYASLNQLTEAVGTEGTQGTGEGAGDNQSADNRSAPEPEGCDEKDELDDDADGAHGANGGAEDGVDGGGDGGGGGGGGGGDNEDGGDGGAGEDPSNV